MNRKLLLSAALISATFAASAQQQNLAYAITGKPDNQFFWANIKQIDMATGNVVKTLFEANKTIFTTAFVNKSDAINTIANPTAYGVAACALDARNNRLYFAPMHYSDIYYLDLTARTANFTVIKKGVIKTPGTSAFQVEENHMTRMVIAPDGNGYALSNDANHLIRFSTDKNPVVEDLGAVTDAANNAISFHDKLSSWGGDMVADAFGKLVVVSAKHNVFSIDVNTKTATFLGTITGLPENYTTNGTAVNTDGNIVVSSANVFDGLYTVNLSDFKAVKIQSTEKTFNASDLANGNYLSQKQFDDMKSILPGGCIVTAKSTKVFPNPLITNKFSVQFNNQDAGTYNIVLTDLAGKSIQSTVINLAKGETAKTVTIGQKPNKGFYMVKVLNAAKKTISTERVLIN